MNDVVPVAKAILYTTINDERVFLLTKETHGIYYLPGGGQNPEDKDLVATLKRELSEELSLESG
ncbi:NUDIX domain-containing protein [Candidatus Roizmanbacteria bacterium]|nr:NUDIX domain-containing protein [Candidatus Roizmanbacteria bacterium]